MPDKGTIPLPEARLTCTSAISTLGALTGTNHNPAMLQSLKCPPSYLTMLVLRSAVVRTVDVTLMLYPDRTLQYEEERSHLPAHYEPGVHPSGARPREGFGAVYLRHGR